MIPLSVVDVRESEPLVLEVLRSGGLTQGPMVARLEEAFARFAGTAHAVAVHSGTAAIVAALRALDLQPGDEVITSPFTGVGTLNAILEAGATARFADVTPEDFTLAPDAVCAALTARTRAVLPVHLFGQPADMGKLMPLAEEHGLHVVEDAAQSLGATVHGQPVGSFGLGCFSLYADQNVTTGEGGVITCDDDALADRLRLLRDHGMRAHDVYEIPGHDYRMSDIHAAIGIPQLDLLDERIAARRHNARQLCVGLSGSPGLLTPSTPPGRSPVWQEYPVRIGPHAMLSREELAEELARRGIATAVRHPRLVFEHAAFRDHPRIAPSSPGDFPVARRLTGEALSLPVHSRLTESDVDRIVAEVRDALGA